MKYKIDNTVVDTEKAVESTQNKTKFTPGPWRLSEDGSVLGPREGASSVVISNSPVWFGRQEFGNGHVTQERLAANARLISAAPELYAVCDMITRVTPESDPVIMFALVEKARAALAKAGGGQ